jgi:putative ABC transport system substrate-binding protein
MRRREFIALLGGAAPAWPLAAHAQQTVMPLVGFINGGAPDAAASFGAAFRRGLAETGYVEGQNVTVEYHWLDGRYEQLPALMAELVRRRVDVIATPGAVPAALAAKAATTTIPIVFTVTEDPVRLGLVANLSRPGANVTGVNIFTGELIPKRLELMREMVPAMTRVAIFVNPASPVAEFQRGEAESAGRAMGLSTQIFNVGTSREINTVFATFARERPDALFFSPDPLYIVQRVQIATLAARHAIPTSFSTRDPIEVGGLMSYGSKAVDGYREAGVYTGRILKGTKPADLPVVQISKFELVINAQTALMLGLTIPDKLLVVADEVIE